MEHPLHADVLVDFRPVDTLSRPDQAELRALGWRRLRKPPRPSQRHTDDPTVCQVGDDLAFRDAHVADEGSLPRVVSHAFMLRSVLRRFQRIRVTRRKPGCVRHRGDQPELAGDSSRSTWTCGGSLQSKLVKKNRYGPGMPLIRGTHDLLVLSAFVISQSPATCNQAVFLLSRLARRSLRVFEGADVGRFPAGWPRLPATLLRHLASVLWNNR